MKILGTTISALTRDDALAQCANFLLGDGQHIIVTPNPEMLVDAHSDLEFRDILNRADLALPDGIGLVLMARIFGVQIPERIAGSDFLADLCALAERESKSVYLMGAPPGVAASAGRVLQKLSPRLRIAGTDSGFTLPAAEQNIHSAITRIQNVQPDILFVALGHGKQEKWIAKYLNQMPSVKIAMGVGGAFDFLAGTVRRAPRFLRAIGLEWLWRLLREPWRASRIFKAVIQFPFLATQDRLSPKKHSV